MAYLVTGWSGGYGGVSWALTDAKHGPLPMPGEWSLEEACQFAESIVYGRIAQDDPADLDALKSPPATTVGVQGLSVWSLYPSLIEET